VGSAATKKGNLLDKIIAQGGGPVLGLFSPKDTATVNGYFKRARLEIYCQQTSVM
jgi:SecD/SecF fusion protein